jgi:hypothetical protein
MFGLAVRKELDAAYPNLSEQMQALIREGADPNISANVDISFLSDPNKPLLSNAISRNDTALMQTCVDHGARLIRRDPEKNFIADTKLTVVGMKILLEAKANIQHRDSYNRGLLHIWAKQGDPNVLAFLCSAGLDPNRHSDERCGYLNSNSGKTPLHEIPWHYDPLELNLKKMAILLFAGADPNLESWDGSGHITVFDYIKRPTHYDQNEDVYNRAEVAASHLIPIVAELSKKEKSILWKEEYWPIIRQALIDRGVVLD